MTECTIGDICTWSKGFQVPRDDTSVDKEVPYLHYGDLYKKYDFRLDLQDKLDKIIKIDNSSKIKDVHYLHDGDIVFALTSETVDDLGHCTLIINPGDLPFVSGMETTVIHIKRRDCVLPSYLNYYFHDSVFQNRLRQYVTGMKVYRVHPDDIMSMVIDLPTIEVQRRIVRILDAITDSMYCLNQINDNLRAIAFSKYNHLKRSCIDYVSLSEIAEVCYGKDHKSLIGGNIPVYGSGGIMRYVERPLYDGKESVLIPRKGTLNNVMFVSTPFWSVDTMFYTKMKCQTAGKYLYFYLHDLDLASMNSGSAVPSMTTEILNDIQVPFPEKDALDNFDKELQPLFDMIKMNEGQINHLSLIRDVLLPKLMSGEIDVSTLEIPN